VYINHVRIILYAGSFFPLSAFCTIGSRQLSEQVDRARFPIGPWIFLNAAIFRPDMESLKPLFPEIQLSEPSAKVYNTLSRFGGDYTRGVNW
jgi:hypothetical protein